MDRAQAAADVLAVQWHYASRGRSLASAALAGARHFVEWAHYPRDDHVDPASGVRFYYHAHPAAERAAAEHGHFHVFVPTPRVPGAISHLVGISLDAKGLPLRLFTTNRWVTGETWRDAGTIAALLPDLTLRAAGPLAPVARWVMALLRLYDDVVIDLLYQRDRRLAPGEAALEDHRLHIVSQQSISLPHRLERAAARLNSPKEEAHVTSV